MTVCAKQWVVLAAAATHPWIEQARPCRPHTPHCSLRTSMCMQDSRPHAVLPPCHYQQQAEHAWCSDISVQTKGRIHCHRLTIRGAGEMQVMRARLHARAGQTLPAHK